LFKVLYILCGNLSTTPRALQSAKAACANGYDVKLIGINRGDNWLKIDGQLAASNKFEYEVVSIDHKNFINWILITFIHRFCFYLEKIFIKSVAIKAYASSKENYLLWKRLRRETCDFDMVIGHSAHSLYPAWQYSRKHKIPFAFDIEDYHPGQVIDKIDEFQVFLIKQLLPLAYYCTYASPLIGQKIQSLIGKTPLKNAILINNSFPESEFVWSDSKINNQEPKVHFVWFSQNIAANRGLEIIIPELKNVSEKVQLHLIGNLYTEFNKEWIEPNKHFITTYPPMEQSDLNKFIGKFDIGLALELNTADYNRQICLTNKIWAYLQAGLYIIATNTPAQVLFMEEHYKHGLLFNQCNDKNPNVTLIENPIRNYSNEPLGKSLKSALKFIINEIDAIRHAKKDRFEMAKDFSFEKEADKCTEIWNRLINNANDL